jgi:glyoxylase-like metal-dependent hydrolase (beta-lactamase superfamily II)
VYQLRHHHRLLITTLMLRKSLVVGPVGCNCTVVACPVTHEALIVDPGGDAGKILALLAKMGARAVGIVHTHGHFDHILGTREVAAATSAPVSIHGGDLELYRGLVRQARYFDLVAEQPPEPAQILAGGETLSFGQLKARILHTPGHTPGSVGLYIETTGAAPLLLAGDTLFAGGIGRTDLPGGSWEQILRSIRDTLFALPDETVVVPGHGDETTIGEEREENPYVGRRASAG